AAEPEEDDLDYRREPEVEIPAADVSAWFGVRTGLLGLVVSHATLAGGLFIFMVVQLIALSSSSSPGKFVLILEGFSYLAAEAGWILAVAAGAFLLGTTPRRGARGLAVGVLLMSALAVLTGSVLFLGPGILRRGIGGGGDGPLSAIFRA